MTSLQDSRPFKLLSLPSYLRSTLKRTTSCATCMSSYIFFFYIANNFFVIGTEF